MAKIKSVLNECDVDFVTQLFDILNNVVDKSTYTVEDGTIYYESDEVQALV